MIVRNPILPGFNPAPSIAENALARCSLDTLPNKFMAREYRLALPAVKKLEVELGATRKRLERAGKGNRFGWYPKIFQE